LFPGHHLQYDERGRRIGAKMVMIQWQNGVPVVVYPDDVSVAQPQWKA
jgi:branched-chain amino acid transport system substrate-binding protein